MKHAIAFLVLTAAWAQVSAVPAHAFATPVAPSQQEQNKTVARRVFDEILSRGRFEVAGEVYARDFVNHGLHRDVGLADDLDAARFEKQACPDLKVAVVSMVAEGDLVSVLWIASGTNTARAGWVPATGARIELRGITIWRIRDGRVREEWTSFNELSVARQIAHQLRWRLIVAFCVALILFWVTVKAVRGLLAARSRA
jgi:steroid delta-isomerase-like uncharacterized protein